MAPTTLATTQQADAASAQTTTDPKYLIIACDGGGIRGLVTAMLLNQLNTDHSAFLKLFANNPSTVALTSLIASGIALEDIWMLSLDTGETQDCYPPSIINNVGAGNFGPIDWIWPVSQPDPPVAGQSYTPSLPLISAIFDATAQIDHLYCALLLQNRYMRARVPLSQPAALDDYSPTAITTMTDSTNAYIQSSQEWADIQSWITTNFG